MLEALKRLLTGTTTSHKVPVKTRVIVEGSTVRVEIEADFGAEVALPSETRELSFEADSKQLIDGAALSVLAMGIAGKEEE